MRFEPTTLQDVWLIRTEKFEDDRGYFARASCTNEFEEAGLPSRFVQSSLSVNRKAGTFRGLHFQFPPSEEGKLVRCLRGGIHDVLVDIRPDSTSFLRHEWFKLTANNLDAVFIPPGFAHGFLTTREDTLVHYEMTDFYAPELGGGIRWSDPVLSLALPAGIAVINDRDANYPDLDTSSLELFSRQPGVS